MDLHISNTRTIVFIRLFVIVWLCAERERGRVVVVAVLQKIRCPSALRLFPPLASSI